MLRTGQAERHEQQAGLIEVVVIPVDHSDHDLVTEVATQSVGRAWCRREPRSVSSRFQCRADQAAESRKIRSRTPEVSTSRPDLAPLAGSWRQPGADHTACGLQTRWTTRMRGVAVPRPPCRHVCSLVQVTITVAIIPASSWSRMWQW